jgi:hypothetical protein
MKRVVSLATALLLAAVTAGPVAAIDFPEQSHIQSCAVLQSLPKDILAHLFDVSPATAEKLFATLTDACNL